MNAKRKKGNLIVIEGTDGSGKATQSLRLKKRLNGDGVACALYSFPIYDSPTGDIIERYLGRNSYGQEFGPSIELNPKIASTFFALNRWASSEEIKRKLESGINVICDRGVESNMAHQGAKLNYVGERDELIKWLEGLEYNSLKFPRSDLVVFLDMPEEVTNELRKNRDKIADGHEQNREYLRHSREVYLELANLYGWERIDCAPNETRDSLKSIEDIGNEVYDIVSRKIQNT